MTNNIAKLFWTVVIGITLTSTIAFTAEIRPIKLTFSIFFPPSHVQTKAAMDWAKEIEKLTDNKVQITVFPGGTLTKAPQCYDGVVKGISDLGFSLFAYTRGRFPVMAAVDLPMGYTSGKVASRVAQEFAKTFKPKELNDVKVLYLHAHGPGLLHTKKPVKKLEDLKGMKIRATGLSAKILEALGGVPVVMPQGETYEALKKGVVEGTFGPMEVLKGLKQAEVIKYTTECYSVGYTTTFFVVMNLDKWNALPADIQKIFDEVSDKYTDVHGNVWDSTDQEGRTYTQSLGNEIIALTDEESARWRNAVEPIINDFINNTSHGKKYVEKIIAQIHKYGKATYYASHSNYNNLLNKPDYNYNKKSITDLSPPSIFITSPPVERGIKIVSNEKRIWVKGKASDKSGIYEVIVNGTEADLSVNGEFAAEVLLAVGKNTIRVKATDSKRNSSEKTFSIIRKTKSTSMPVLEQIPKYIVSKPSSENYYALIIGNNNYRYLPTLQTPVNDAKAVANILERKYGFKTEILFDATRKNIMRALNDFRKKLRDNDNFLIYYAGHGEYDMAANKAYWLPVDSLKDDDSNWIIVDTITSNVKRVSSRHVLIVADSCYSGTLTRRAITNLRSSEERNRYLEKLLNKISRTLLASGGNEPVSDSGGQGHSVFASAFIDGLKSMDKEVFTAEELFYEHIKERVGGNSEQTPEYNTIRNSGHNGGDFVFMRVAY